MKGREGIAEDMEKKIEDRIEDRQRMWGKSKRRNGGEKKVMGEGGK